MSKPRRNVTSLSEKAKMIKEVNDNPNEKKIDIARRLQVPASTLNSIMYQKKKILLEIEKGGDNAKKKKSIRKSPFEEIEVALFAWFQQARASGIPVNGPIIKEKALQIAVLQKNENFVASNGWMERFKSRHGLSRLKKSRTGLISGESASVDPMIPASWNKEKLLELTKGYDDCDIYTAEETGMHYNLLPNKILKYWGDAANRSKERLTVFVCVNKDGSDKLKPLIIGKYQKRKCFKNNKFMPAKYLSNKNALMTGTFFMDWLHEFDARMGSDQRKVILFVDQCSTYASNTSALENVKCVFFPPNCTSVVRPLDSGVISSMKQHYRRRLLRKIITLMDCGSNTSSMKISMLQAIHFIAVAWQQVTPQTITNCFRKCGFVRPKKNNLENNHSEESDKLEVTSSTRDDHISHNDNEDDNSFADDWNAINVTKEIIFDDFVDVDDRLITCGVDTLTEICNQQLQNQEDSESDGENDEDVVIFNDAVSYFEKVKKYLYSKQIGDNVMQGLNTVEKAIFDTNRVDVPIFMDALSNFKIVKKYLYSKGIGDEFMHGLNTVEKAILDTNRVQ